MEQGGAFVQRADAGVIHDMKTEVQAALERFKSSLHFAEPIMYKLNH